MQPFPKVATQRPCTKDERWFVRTAAGVKTMSLDQLDKAFKGGVIDARSLVWTRGMEAWAALGDVANLEDGPPLESAPARLQELNEHAMLGFGTVMPPLRIENDNSIPPLDANESLWASIMPVSKPVHERVRGQLGELYASVRAPGGLAAHVRNFFDALPLGQPSVDKGRNLFVGVLCGLALGFSLYWAVAGGTKPKPQPHAAAHAASARVGTPAGVLGSSAAVAHQPAKAPPAGNVKALREAEGDGASQAILAATPAPSAAAVTPSLDQQPTASVKKARGRSKALARKQKSARRSSKASAARAASTTNARARALSGLGR